jgi:hypothetical protein
MIVQVISTSLLLAVAIVSLAMAFEGLAASRFLPFHANASGLKWESLDTRVQMVIMSLIRINGFAFLIVSLLIVMGIGATYWLGNDVLQIASSVAALAFSLGLWLSNYRLERGTGARTPWRGSIIAASALGIALVLALSVR